LYLAGDYCQNPIDLVSMEGAVSSGLIAADAIRSDLSLQKQIEILEPEVHPRWLTAIGRCLLFPIALLAKAWMLFTRPANEVETSDVPPTDLKKLPSWPVRVVDESLPECSNTIG
jgi:hypothetical protein